jgi:hypothetical protein
MKDKFKIEATTNTGDGHKRIKLAHQTTGNVSLVINTKSYECDSLKSARALAHRICRRVLSAREKRMKENEEHPECRFQLYDDDKKWVEYKILLKDTSNIESLNPPEDDFHTSLYEDERVEANRPHHQVIIERYPQRKAAVRGYEKGQAGRPESNRRKF